MGVPFVICSLPTDVSNHYLIVGDKAHGLEWIERAHEMRDPSTPCLRMPIYDSIRSEPRFQ
jgi:hypothetical protein